MPGKSFIMHILGIILQYTFVCLLYYFLYRIIKVISSDLRHTEISHPAATLPSFDKFAPLKLHIIDSGGHSYANTHFELIDTMTLGRDSKNNIIIPDSFVSHEHACITRDKHGYWLSDLKSTNGTYLNDRRLDEDVVLMVGDIIKIGSVIFAIER